MAALLEVKCRLGLESGVFGHPELRVEIEGCFYTGGHPFIRTMAVGMELEEAGNDPVESHRAWMEEDPWPVSRERSVSKVAMKRMRQDIQVGFEFVQLGKLGSRDLRGQGM